MFTKSCCIENLLPVILEPQVLRRARNKGKFELTSTFHPSAFKSSHSSRAVLTLAGSTAVHVGTRAPGLEAGLTSEIAEVNNTIKVFHRKKIFTYLVVGQDQPSEPGNKDGK
jgi:hypothetical protein